jgi:TorA maturation chaperone TorD
MSATPMPMPAPARPPASPIQPGTSSLNGTTMINRTTLAQLREMDAAQAARQPVDHLALLLERGIRLALLHRPRLRQPPEERRRAHLPRAPAHDGREDRHQRRKL